MMCRMLISPCLILLCLGSTFAQAPPAAPADPPKTALEDAIGPLPVARALRAPGEH